MKKIIALALCLGFALSLVACHNPEDGANQQLTSDAVVSTESKKENINDEADVHDDVTDTDISFENVTSFEDFKEKFDKSGYKPNVKEAEDKNVVIIDIQTPENDDDTDKETTSTTVAPAIPTIDRIEKPEKPIAPANPTPNNPEAEPEEDTKEDTEDITTPDPVVTPDEPTVEPEKPQIQKPQEPQYTYTTGQTHTKLHYSKRYLYSTLNDEQKEWYQAIDKAVNNIDAEVRIDSDLSIDRNYYIFYMYLFDNPEHFYLCNSVCVHNHGDGTTTLSFYYSVGNQKGEYCGYGYGSLTDELKNKIIAKKAIFEAEVDSIISTIPADAPDVWKERLIYDRILMDSHYNLGARWDGLANDNWTAYGILVNKYGVCESYSEAFQTLCAYVGIKCTGVVGTAGGGHKWNAVELDGEWYMCDVTFDDPIGGEQGAAYHYYFNRTSEWFVENGHDWTNCDFSVPECNGTKYDFENCFGTDRW